ncbi:protein of unknown function DUF81 [Thalassoporum mexicanum PCC 7367]|uniref:sulfite exporter TauE/SafE family protein n=1 Tax=Thalassoporum mexicanum TaxID=3457544 RepID=UPI00029FE8B3|nr:sulfite exporter TauE/SafE family protein [Pseudanabaena sp. PCC 7367]AFY71558.1 protein of unknown function DUF81 [Pseudanabaena sp. PCC 7367]
MEIIAVIFITFLAALVQGTVGFGSGLTAVPMLLYVIDIKAITPFVALLGFLINLTLCIYLRQHFNFRLLAPLLGGALLGIPFGIWFLHNAPEKLIRVILAIVMLAYVGYAILNRRRNNHQEPGKLNQKWGYPVGFGSGCLTGAFSTGGPPIILWAMVQNWQKEEFRGSMPAFYLCSGFFALIGYGWSGLITFDVMRLFLVSIPALLLGIWVGDRLSNKLDRDKFKLLVQVSLIVLAIMLISS